MEFNINPVFTTKVLLDKYVHECVIYTGTRDYVSVLNLFIKYQTEDDWMDLLNEYAKREKIQTITFEDWENDCRMLISIIEESDYFKELYQFAKSDYLHFNWLENYKDA